MNELFEKNRAWAEAVRQADPEFFQRLAQQQSPSYLWIGCSDSRVPANQIVGLLPGEMFVHRNLANIVEPSDLNCLSVVQFAVDLLKVKDIIVCGHYGCAGIRAAQRGERIGLADRWLHYLQNVRQKHAAKLSAITSEAECADRLCELNVIEQVRNVCETTICQTAWKRGQPLAVHGWIYSINDGLLRDLKMTVSGLKEMLPAYHIAVSALWS